MTVGLRRRGNAALPFPADRGLDHRSRARGRTAPPVFKHRSRPAAHQVQPTGIAGRVGARSQKPWPRPLTRCARPKARRQIDPGFGARLFPHMVARIEPRGRRAPSGDPSLSLEETSDALQPLLRLSYLGHPQAEVAIHQHYFAAGHDLVAHNEVDSVGDMAVELHHVSRSQVENLAQRHLPAAETQGGLKLDVEEQFDSRRHARGERRNSLRSGIRGGRGSGFAAAGAGAVATWAGRAAGRTSSFTSTVQERSPALSWKARETFASPSIGSNFPTRHLTPVWASRSPAAASATSRRDLRPAGFLIHAFADQRSIESGSVQHHRKTALVVSSQSCRKTKGAGAERLGQRRRPAAARLPAPAPEARSRFEPSNRGRSSCPILSNHLLPCERPDAHPRPPPLPWQGPGPPTCQIGSVLAGEVKAQHRAWLETFKVRGRHAHRRAAAAFRQSSCAGQSTPSAIASRRRGGAAGPSRRSVGAEWCSLPPPETPD